MLIRIELKTRFQNCPAACVTDWRGMGMGMVCLHVQAEWNGSGVRSGQNGRVFCAQVGSMVDT